MGVLIDSNILIDWERSGGDIGRQVRGHEEDSLFLSVISASELLHGVHRAKNPSIRAQRSAFVEAALSLFPLLDIDLAIARSHAQLWAELTKQGQRIGMNDSWIAASCLAHGLKLATFNEREFRRVPGLEIMVWGKKAYECQK